VSTSRRFIEDVVHNPDGSADIIFGNGSTTLDYLTGNYPWLPAVLATPAVLTGSRAYGHPRPDSDIDLVILVDEPALAALEATQDRVDDEAGTLTRKHYVTQDYGLSYEGRGRSASLRFGRLNLIATTNPDLYAAWKEGTEELVSRAATEKRPVERPEAVAAIKAYLEEALS
jgi:hypothetical protein